MQFAPHEAGSLALESGAEHRRGVGRSSQACGATFAYPNALTSYQWACRKALYRARQEDEAKEAEETGSSGEAKTMNDERGAMNSLSVPRSKFLI